MRYVVPEHEAGERLDAWLAQREPRLSRSSFQKLIKAGAVLVNGKPGKSGYVMKENDVVETGEAPAKAANAAASYAPVRIVEETPEFIVLEKPSGLLVHPAPNQKTDTLSDFLVARDAAIAKVGDSPERPGIVHRLDREASGLMVTARTPAAFEHLKKQFQTHAVAKEYLALVWGKVVKDHEIITTPIGRVRGLGRMAAHVEAGEDDKEARTSYDVIERFPHATLVRVKTETGRMHQVRVHMKSIGHPLVGDTLYGAGKKSPSLDKCPRLFLHAAYLAFTGPDGARHEYRSELPEDLKSFLETLKKKHGKA